VSSHLVVFVKNPVPGTVKTRLTPALTPEQAAAVYRAFVKDVLRQGERIPVDARVLAFAPADARRAVAVLASHSWQLAPQADTDLGGRMAAAADRRFRAGAERVVIIGTDAPTLPDEHLRQAFDLLRATDVVLGPSTDGGYYLVGLSGPRPDVFHEVDWSTGRVLRQTVDRIQAANLRLGLLPPWYDVDTPDELEFLRAHLAASRLAGHPLDLPDTTAVLAGRIPPPAGFPPAPRP
jgi:rSAM/selenodomain-associated transferase 1